MRHGLDGVKVMELGRGTCGVLVEGCCGWWGFAGRTWSLCAVVAT